MDKDIRYKEMIGYLKESKEFIFINIVTMVFISAFLVSEDLPIIDIFLIIVGILTTYYRVGIRCIE